MKKEKQSWGIDRFTLKMIALITMLIDHIGVVLYPDLIILRKIGRISFPIFCFLLVEGFHHTKDIKRYGIRLFMFAFLSEIPFDLASYGRFFSVESQNIFFTLFLGLCIMWLLEYWKEQELLKVLVIIISMGLAWVLHLDYGAFGILQILVFYISYKKRFAQSVCIVLLHLLSGNPIQIYGGFSVLPICFYNGKRGSSMKYFFYAFYPVHLLLLYGIAKFYFHGLS